MMSKQFVNILGAIVVVVIAVAGVVFVGLPLLSQSFDTSAQASQVDAQNAAYATQVTRLEQAKKEFSSLSESVDSLQRQIPTIAQNNDVFQLVSDAAEATGVTVKSVTASKAEDWTERTAASEGTQTGGPATAPSPGGATANGAPEPSSAPAQPTPAPTAGSESGDGSAPADTPSGAATSVNPQKQIPFLIVVDTDDPGAAAAFIDALGKGPRLLGIIHSALIKNDNGGALELTVNAIAFVRVPQS